MHLSKTLMTAAFLAFSTAAHADPCGMVPPIHVDAGGAGDIERTGLQQTYGFYKDGIETLVIRPGFVGNVEEFGMLVPFPSPPALRKIDDKTFEHLAAAVDPPEVQVHLYDDTPRPEVMRMSRSAGAPSAAMEDSSAPMKLKKDEVRVINEEAVGMYEVAVLEAGSPKALKRWMEDHAFRYPDGMEDTVGDYVREGWVFVAIKAHVASAAATSPRPGLRSVNMGLPPGASFNGFVQGMGFRFEVDAPVIPMRLSGFNGDDSHNRVYFLSDEPLRIAGVPKSTVRRQVDGRDLYRHLSSDLDVRVNNGDAKQISDHWWTQIDPLRDPAPFNGVAKDLLASDLLSVDSGSLSLPFEEREKELLRISESLGLRGAAIDEMHATELDGERDEALADVLWQVRGMTLTVLDGDFPRELLADQNLEFRPWEMLAENNVREQFNLQPAGPELWVPYSRSIVPW